MASIAENWGKNNFYASPPLRARLHTRPGTTIGDSVGHAKHPHMSRGSGRLC
jgi:hypothetical protein